MTLSTQFPLFSQTTLIFNRIDESQSGVENQKNHQIIRDKVLNFGNFNFIKWKRNEIMNNVYLDESNEIYDYERHNFINLTRPTKFEEIEIHAKKEIQCIISRRFN